MRSVYLDEGERDAGSLSLRHRGKQALACDARSSYRICTPRSAYEAAVLLGYLVAFDS